MTDVWDIYLYNEWVGEIVPNRKCTSERVYGYLVNKRCYNPDIVVRLSDQKYY